MVQQREATDDPRCDHPVVEERMKRRDYAKELSTSAAKSIDEIILGGLPAIFDIGKLSRHRIQGAPFEIFSYEGRPFLELHDLEFDRGFDGDKYMVKVSQKYRYIKHP